MTRRLMIHSMRDVSGGDHRLACDDAVLLYPKTDIRVTDKLPTTTGPGVPY